jgi:16S rRNA (cytosine1402-N4)-methyltransferase
MTDESLPLPVYHPSVLTKEVIEYLKAERGGHLWVDATLGSAGHAIAIGRAVEGHGMLLGIERDPHMASLAENRLAEFSQHHPDWRYWIRIGSYRELPESLSELGLPPPRGIVADLGVSYLQLRTARGIGFQNPEAPLDGRFNPAENGLTIGDLVNTWSAQDIANVLWRYGDESKSRSIARKIVEARRRGPLTRVGELAEIIRSCFPPRRHPGLPDPITKSWQALRIRVNEELEHVEEGLRRMIEALAPGGRLVVIAFHSGETRIVKRVFAEAAGPATDPTNPYTLHPERPQRFRIVTRKAVLPGEVEYRENPGSRSAGLRCLERIA